MERLIASEVIAGVKREQVFRLVRRRAAEFGYYASLVFLSDEDEATQIFLFSKSLMENPAIDTLTPSLGKVVLNLLEYDIGKKWLVEIYYMTDWDKIGYAPDYTPDHVAVEIMRYLLRKVEGVKRADEWRPMQEQGDEAGRGAMSIATSEEYVKAFGRFIAEQDCMIVVSTEGARTVIRADSATRGPIAEYIIELREDGFTSFTHNQLGDLDLYQRLTDKIYAHFGEVIVTAVQSGQSKPATASLAAADELSDLLNPITLNLYWNAPKLVRWFEEFFAGINDGDSRGIVIFHSPSKGDIDIYRDPFSLVGIHCERKSDGQTLLTPYILDGAQPAAVAELRQWRMALEAVGGKMPELSYIDRKIKQVYDQIVADGEQSPTDENVANKLPIGRRGEKLARETVNRHRIAMRKIGIEV